MCLKPLSLSIPEKTLASGQQREALMRAGMPRPETPDIWQDWSKVQDFIFGFSRCFSLNPKSLMQLCQHRFHVKPVKGHIPTT